MNKTTEKGGIRNDFERKEVVGVCHRDMRVSLIGSSTSKLIWKRA